MASVTDPQSDEPAEEPTPSRTKRLSTYGLVAVSVVALAVVIVGLTLPGPEPELTTAPPPSTEAPSSAAAPTENNVVDEPFDPKAPIPGCDSVEVPDTGEGRITSKFTTDEARYDNPRFPWFTGPKATAMSNALREVLPAGAELQFARRTESLIFQPITDFGDAEPTGATNAYGSVVNGDASGQLQVAVEKTSSPAPACVAGQLDERRTLPGGIVVDVHDTWQEVNGVRTNTRTARAYVADGSSIDAIADDRTGGKDISRSGRVPLTIEDLVRIVSDPRLRVTAAVPPGTPSPREECLASYGGAEGPEVTAEQARRLDRVLATIDLDGRRPLPLQPSDSTSNALCTSIPAQQPSPRIDISIAGDQPLPVEKRPEPGSGGRSTFRRLDDGAILQTTSDFYSSTPMNRPQDATTVMSQSAILTRPDGTQIAVTSGASAPERPVSPDTLQSIALTPGLEL